MVIDGQVCIIPAKTVVVLNITATHSSPKYWGDDSLVWRPSRWIATTMKPGSEQYHEDSRGHGNDVGAEKLIDPKPGAFFPWSSGERVCPGKRYAQVEFVAVLSALLWKHHVDPVAIKGESISEARARVLNVLADCKFNMTLHMRHPSSVGIKWTCRRSRKIISQ